MSENQRTFWPYIVATAMGLIGICGLVNFGDSIFGLPCFGLVFFAILLVVNRLYRREIRPKKGE